MFPIRDHNPSECTPYVRNLLILLNVAMFLLTTPWLGGAVEIWDRLALYPVAIMHGEWLWGLVTHMFLHAGIMHIAGNMLFCGSLATIWKIRWAMADFWHSIWPAGLRRRPARLPPIR